MSDAELHERASELFLRLRALPSPERDAALAALVDRRLAAEVASLCAHDDDAPYEPRAHAFDSAPTLPKTIGPYRVLSRIGRGGSGQVYLAEQDVPIHRRVAIKVVPQAAASPELAARFEIERRALECTDHPHITRVLDAGRTAEGLPYLVMNFVEGEPITEHCVRLGLPLEQRIRLMIDVADAIQHAHQRGVIHRDVKPANVLVAKVDGRSVPQVLDFGIAKPVSGAIASESPPTLGLPMGTPAYMAPEQTGVGTVDTRADVYGLGALLYELTTGRPPLEPTIDPLEVLRRVREEVPEPASRAREHGGARAAPGAPSRALQADLDVVLAHALEKEPDRRYASVGALIDDLWHLLACEPITARAPSWRYRTARFVERNRVLVGAACVAFAAVCVGVVGLGLGLLEARRQRAEALDQGDAQREINRFLTDDLLAAASPDRLGENATMRQMLDRASRGVDARFAGRPLIAGAIHHTLGEAYAELSAFDEAERHHARAIELRRKAGGPDSPELLHSEIAAASLLARRGLAREAAEAFPPLIGRAREVLGSDDLILFAALNDYGVALEGLDRNDEALSVLQEALDGRRRLLGPDDFLIATTLNNLAQGRGAKGDVTGAIDLMREALRVVESSPEPARFAQLGLYNNIGATYQDLERNAEAEPYLLRAAEIAANLLGPGDDGTLTLESNLAGLAADLGRPAEAAERYAHVITAREALNGPRAFETLNARHGYWSSRRKAGAHAEAVEGFLQLSSDVRDALGAEHSLAEQCELSLARALVDADRAADALPHAEWARERMLARYGAEHPRTKTATELVEALRAADAKQ
ncbi:MAG: serine/threonine-protein kinase [Planctomycetes bacterium]|nr:serine/threonine-protein kinase [Planctomycetota bacterium]